jgi:USP6 N-terminal-like protein
MILPVRRNEDVWKLNVLKEHKLRERVYKGIPDRWRRAVWDLLILGFRGSVSHGKYTDLLNEPSEFDIQIDLDVPRTISGHVMFRTRYGLG